jgi:hypothetical protein
VPVSIWIAASLGAVSTWAQLYVRFSERRPFESLKTATLFVFIGLFASVISGALASVPLLPVGGEVAGATVGLGTSVPFSQVPGGSLRSDCSGGCRDPDVAAGEFGEDVEGSAAVFGRGR